MVCWSLITIDLLVNTLSYTHDYLSISLSLAALMCNALAVPDNGGITYTTSDTDFPPYELGTTAEYSCFLGFGFSVNMLVSVSTICQSDSLSLNGEWVGAELTCSRKCNWCQYYSG